MSDLEFIQRAQIFLKYKVKEEDEKRSASRWSKKNPEGHKKARKKYEKTAKGKAAISLVHYHRRKKIRNARSFLTSVERRLIGEFYINCPPGYEVDHIIPISKGGIHTLENLQYLTISENRRKSNKILKDEFLRMSSFQVLQLHMDEMRIFLECHIRRCYGPDK